MKRQVFRLGSVLRFYELQKQRSEMELQRALNILHELDQSIARLMDVIATLSELVAKDKGDLTTTGWIACYRNVEHLNRRLVALRHQRLKQAEIVAKLREQRKRWAISEETLLHLKKEVHESNQIELAKAEQIQADETEFSRSMEENDFGK